VDYSLSDVAQLWVLEEATDDVWELLQPMERGQRLALQIRKTVDPGPTDRVTFDVLPHPLTRVELGRVARQETGAAAPRWRRTP
jgi:hypothetical protein